MLENERTSRDEESRDSEQREESWKPPTLLPKPKDDDGFVYRWVRTRIMGDEDNMNMSRSFREGWEPVRAEDHPEMQVVNDYRSQFSDNIEMGGLILCKMSKEKMAQKRAYLDDRSSNQMEAVDNNYMRESNPRMPLLKPERSTKVTFGGSGR